MINKMIRINNRREYGVQSNVSKRCEFRLMYRRNTVFRNVIRIVANVIRILLYFKLIKTRNVEYGKMSKKRL